MLVAGKRRLEQLAAIHVKRIMRTIISFIGMAGFGGWYAAGQAVFPHGWTETPVFIQHSAGSGSGFFLQYSNKVFLVTAKHVLFDSARFPSLVLLATNATCTVWSARTNVSAQVAINLAGSFAASQTRGHSSRDVAVVLISVVETNGFRGSDFAKPPGPAPFPLQLVIANDQTMLFKDVPVGSDIYTFGYPSSIGLQAAPQIDQTRPLVRRGIVAGKDPNRRTLVLDSPVFKGNSGGPIVERGSEFGFQAKVIGIAVEFVPFEERWLNSQFGYSNTTISNSGYSIAEPMDSVFEVLW